MACSSDPIGTQISKRRGYILLCVSRALNSMREASVEAQQGSLEARTRGPIFPSGRVLYSRERMEGAPARYRAVIGKQFPLGLVKRVMQKPEDELERMLAALQLGEFVHEQPAFPETEYIFKHALTQELAYGSLLIERRKELHERTASQIEALLMLG